MGLSNLCSSVLKVQQQSPFHRNNLHNEPERLQRKVFRHPQLYPAVHRAITRDDGVY